MKTINYIRRLFKHLAIHHYTYLSESAENFVKTEAVISPIVISDFNNNIYSDTENILDYSATSIKANPVKAYAKNSSIAISSPLVLLTGIQDIFSELRYMSANPEKNVIETEGIGYTFLPELKKIYAKIPATSVTYYAKTGESLNMQILYLIKAEKAEQISSDNTKAKAYHMMFIDEYKYTRIDQVKNMTVFDFCINTFNTFSYSSYYDENGNYHYVDDKEELEKKLQHEENEIIEVN